MWAFVAAIVWSAFPMAGPSESARLYRTENFLVESMSASCDAPAMADSCESWRKRLQAKWLGSETAATWSPPCKVVVHGRRETYRAAVGPGSDQSFGSSWIDSREGRILGRRIDLLIDGQGAVSALGHELTHAVMADAFPGKAPPAWANEGAAVLADSHDKQRLHKRDLDASFRRQTAFHCAELLALNHYPAPHRIPAFYGQSASIIAFLGEVGGSEKLVPFIKDAADQGYDRALKEHYGIQGIADLQRRWLSGM